MSTVDPDDNNDIYNGDCGFAIVTDDVVFRLNSAAAATTCGGTPSDCVNEVQNQQNNGQDH